MSNIRKPKQKRSIECKQSIVKAGYELFQENGYRKTNTIEIAKRAGVSTGAVYGYFKDKRAIYIEAYKQYLQSCSDQLLVRMRAELCQRFDLADFIELWIRLYSEIYAGINQVLAQIRVIMLEDQEINYSFSDFELEYVSALIELLNENGIYSDDCRERVYASCMLVDSLSREKSSFPHAGLNYEILKKNIADAIFHLLSAK